MADDRCNICKGTSARSRMQGRQSGDGANKRGLNTKIHMALNAAGKSVRFIVTSGTEADCSHAKDLIKNTGAKYLLADRGYDTNEIIETAEGAGMEAIIPPKKSRKVLSEYDKNAYKLRHVIENTFLKLKQWRGIATRYVIVKILNNAIILK